MHFYGNIWKIIHSPQQEHTDSIQHRAQLFKALLTEQAR